LETAISGTVFVTALEESPQQLLFSEQSPAFLVSIDGIESHKICVLGSDLISFEVSDFADAVERIERIDACEGITQHGAMFNDNSTLQMHPRLSNTAPY
jgi:hypothetical protein